VTQASRLFHRSHEFSSIPEFSECVLPPAHEFFKKSSLNKSSASLASLSSQHSSQYSPRAQSIEPEDSRMPLKSTLRNVDLCIVQDQVNVSAKLTKQTLKTQAKPEPQSTRNVLLRNEKLEKSVVSDRALRCIKIHNSNLRGSTFSSSDLKHAVIIKADLSNSHFASVDLSTSTLDRVKFKYATFSSNDTGVNFSGAILEGVSFKKSDVSGAIFKGTLFDKVDFRGCQVKPDQFEGAIFKDVKLDKSMAQQPWVKACVQRGFIDKAGVANVPNALSSHQSQFKLAIERLKTLLV